MVGSCVGYRLVVRLNVPTVGHVFLLTQTPGITIRLRTT